MVEEREEGFVGRLTEIGIDYGEGFRRSGVEGLPTACAFEFGESNARGYPESPWSKYGGLAQERKFAEDLKRGFLKDVVGEGGADKTGDVAAQRRMNFTEKPFQGVPVAGLGQKDEEGLAGRLNLL
ncbi:MAG: hypothetical protein ABR987_01885 [Terracidiphilus sp.]